MTVTVTNVEEAGTVSLSTRSPVVGTPLAAVLTDPDGSLTVTEWLWQKLQPGPGAEWETFTPEEVEGQYEQRTYTPKSTDVGLVLRVRVRYRDGHGSGKLAASSETEPVQAPEAGKALSETPAILSLAAAPNPFNPSTAMHIQVPVSGPVTLEVYDLTGRVVRRLLHHQPMPAGAHTLFWEGRDDQDRPVAAGVYFCRLIAPGQAVVRKVTLIR